MKLVGRAFRTIGRRLVIVRCDPAQLPRLYSDVSTKDSLPVGRIVDIFSNIESPCAVVICRGDCSIKPGEPVYVRYEGSWHAGSRKGKIAPVRARSAQKAGTPGQRNRAKERRVR